MKLRHFVSALAVLCFSCFACAAGSPYGTPDTLKAELKEGDDLSFSNDGVELTNVSNLSNALFAPPHKEGDKFPALVIFHTCGGISEHLKVWTEAALNAGYVVLVPDGMRGFGNNCTSPPKVPNARLIKDALDGVAHLAKLPYVDTHRISVLGFSQGAFVATWLASSNVAKSIRPETPAIASTIAAYGFCGLAPSRGRPNGAVILQPDTDRPLLMLLGGKDNETPPDSCLEALPNLKSAGAPVQWHLYPDATHAWDAKEKDGFTKTAYNNKQVTYIYDKGVTEDSMKRVFEFLAQASK